MNLFSIYFSPTGGTRKIGNLVAKKLNENFVEIELEAVFQKRVFAQDDVLVTAIPCFVGRIPVFARERLELLEGNGTKAILIASYGNREFEDQLVEMEDLLKERGFVIVAAGAFIAQHSIVQEIAAGRPDADDEKDLAFFAACVNEKIEAGRVGDFEIPGNRPYREIVKSAAIPYGDERCTSCMACVEACPVNAIPDSKPTDTNSELCIACQRCVVLCPVKCRSIDPDIKSATAQRLSLLAGERKSNKWFL